MGIFFKGAWESFWDSRGSLLPLCLFRASFCILVCAESITWIPHTDELFSSQGFHQGPWGYLAPSPLMAKFLCLALVFVAFSSATGFLTRSSLFVTLVIWTFFFGLDQINEKALHSIVIINLIILLFSASHARLSLDDFLNIKNNRRRLAADGSQLSLRLLQVQLCQVYFFSGFVKLCNNSWVSGETLSQILTSRWATDMGVWFSGILPPAAFYLISISIILYELFAGVCLFIPQVRNYFIVFGVIFHALTLLLFYVGYLGLHYLAGLVILFYDPARLDSCLRGISQKLGYDVYAANH